MYLIDTTQACSVHEVNIDEDIPITELPQEEHHKLVCVTASDYAKLLKWVKRNR